MNAPKAQPFGKGYKVDYIKLHQQSDLVVVCIELFVSFCAFLQGAPNYTSNHYACLYTLYVSHLCIK